MNSSTAEDAEDADSELPASDLSLITYRSKAFPVLELRRSTWKKYRTPVILPLLISEDVRLRRCGRRGGGCIGRSRLAAGGPGPRGEADASPRPPPPSP